MVGQDSQSKFTASREINSLNHNPTHAEAWLLPIGHGPVGRDSWYGFFPTAADASPTIKVCNSEAGPVVFFSARGRDEWDSRYGESFMESAKNGFGLIEAFCFPSPPSDSFDQGMLRS